MDDLNTSGWPSKNDEKAENEIDIQDQTKEDTFGETQQN